MYLALGFLLRTSRENTLWNTFSKCFSSTAVPKHFGLKIHSRSQKLSRASKSFCLGKLYPWMFSTWEIKRQYFKTLLIQLKITIINPLYVNIYNIFSKMKKLVRIVALSQSSENRFNVWLHRKLVDSHTCFCAVSWSTVLDWSQGNPRGIFSYWNIIDLQYYISFRCTK